MVSLVYSSWFNLNYYYMNAFCLRNGIVPDVKDAWHPDASHLPKILDGEDIIDTVMPISKQTGIRENALSLLNKTLDPKYKNLIDGIMQQIPTVNEMQGISDDEALDLLVDFNRFGTPYERDLIRNRLSRSLDVLLPKREQSKSAIQFSSDDEPKEEVK